MLGMQEIWSCAHGEGIKNQFVVPGEFASLIWGTSEDQKAPWLQNCRAAIIPEDHQFKLELDCQCSFLIELAKIIWFKLELPLVELRLATKGRSWRKHLQLGLSFKRQLTFWNCATSKYIKILDVNWCHAMPATSSKAMNLLRQPADLQAVQHGLLPML